MDSNILLGKILQRFQDKKTSQFKTYNSFGYLRETKNAVYVTRENDKETRIPFKKILIGIDVYKTNSALYDAGPTELRNYGITHINSPIHSLLHLLLKHEFETP